MDSTDMTLLKESNDVFESFSSCLVKQLERLEDFSQKEEQSLSFDRNVHWHKIDLCVQAISKESTQLAVAYSKPPIPSKQERKSLLESVLKSVDVLRAWFVAFPLSEGRLLSLCLKRKINSLFECVGDLVSSVKTEGCSESSQRLHLTGKIWKLCESFENIPKDNKSAVLQHLSESYQLITDALQEIEQEIKEQSDNHDLDYDRDEDEEEAERWTDKDKSCLPFCLGLIKTAKGTLKRLQNIIKSKGKITSLIFIDELDKTADSIQRFSTCTDDLVLSMYPAVDHTALLDNAKSLAREIHSCVKVVGNCHFFDDSDTSTLEFLNQATDHNITKFEACLRSTR